MELLEVFCENAQIHLPQRLTPSTPSSFALSVPEYTKKNEIQKNLLTKMELKK